MIIMKVVLSFSNSRRVLLRIRVLHTILRRLIVRMSLIVSMKVGDVRRIVSVRVLRRRLSGIVIMTLRPLILRFAILWVKSRLNGNLSNIRVITRALPF